MTAKRKDAKRSAAELVAERIRLILAKALGEKVKAADLNAVERRLKGEEGAFRTRLHDLFTLTGTEIDALDCAVAVAVEPALGARMAQVQGQPGRLLPTEIALRILFGHGPDPMLQPTGGLLGWAMVRRIAGRPGEPDMIEADPEIVLWHFGRLAPEMLDGVSIARAEAPKPLPEWRVEVHAERIARILAGGRSVRVTVDGLAGTGRSSLAAAVVKSLGRQAIFVEGTGEAVDFRATFRRLQRTALLADLALIWQGEPPAWPVDVPMAPLQFVIVEAGQTPRRRRDLADLAIPMPELTPESLASLARHYLPDLAKDTLSPLGAPRIADLADAEAQKMRSADEFREMLHQRTSERTRGIGRIVGTSYSWGDLVLSDRTAGLLKAVEQEARLRHQLLKDPERNRLFGGAALLTVLMSGPPGTGKSMSSQVLASALGLELMHVDMATMFSKYVGEMQKNLSAVFRAARDANCAILFEEADSLFAKRTEADSVNARYANADTGHLLQLIEGHGGLVMLSTNRRANIDSAFLRRMRFIIEFQMPAVEQRAILWDKLLAPLGVLAKQRAELAAALAPPHELSPAQIKGAILSAAYSAEAAGEAIALDRLNEGVLREFLKEGRLASVAPPPRRSAHG